MKTNDIFEALTDIHDKFLDEAFPTDTSAEKPVVVHPAPRKPLWKTLVPIAACLAVVGTAGTLGVKYLRGHGGLNTSTSASSDEYPANTKNFQYPETAKYIVDEKYYEDPSLFNPCYTTYPVSEWDKVDSFAKSYKELAAQSDLIVAGEIADYTHQTQDPSQVHVSSPETEDLSYNYLRVENVIKGDIKAGQFVLICQNDLISTGGFHHVEQQTSEGEIIMVPNSEGKHAVQLNSPDRLTPMFKGDRWIYFLKKYGDCYEPVNGPQGRYPMPGSNNVDVSNAGDIGMVDEYFALTNSAPARDEIYETVVALLEAAKPKLEEIAIPLFVGHNEFDMEEFPEYDFDVKRTFDGVYVDGYLTDDKVFADVEIIMSGDLKNLFLCDLNGDGKREFCATVVNNGVRSVEVFDRANDKQYTLQGRSKREYYLKVEDGMLMSVFQEDTGKCMLETHDPLSLDNMIPVFGNSSAPTLIGDEKRFKLAEFPDKTFEVIYGQGQIVMYDMNAHVEIMCDGVKEGKAYYLTDLNGDGKREICVGGIYGSGMLNTYINVIDIANDENYDMRSNIYEGLISLDVENDKLYLVKERFHPNVVSEEISREPLTLDLLKKTQKKAYEEIPLFIDRTFTIEDFPGVAFTVDTSTECPTFRFGKDSMSVSDNVNSVYLYDADGDGKREICLNCPFVARGIIRVYGFTDDGEIGCAEYFEDGGCCLSAAEDGTLYYYTTNDKPEPLKFSKSDLKPSLARSYSYELPGWDHSIGFSEILPSLSSYSVEIKEYTLLIKQGDDQIFDSGINLDELYTIYDAENNTATFIYINGYDGGECMVGAIELSESAVKRYDYEKGVTIKPTAEDLIIVYPDGTEKPFKFPENAETIS